MAEYNGWANYETWVVHLWVTNDPDTMAEAMGYIGKNRGWVAAHALRCFVEDWQDAILPDAGASLFVDLIRLALDMVEWQEVSDAIIEANDEATDAS